MARGAILAAKLNLPAASAIAHTDSQEPREFRVTQKEAWQS
jgi:hypothetical protein